MNGGKLSDESKDRLERFLAKLDRNRRNKKNKNGMRENSNDYKTTVISKNNNNLPNKISDEEFFKQFHDESDYFYEHDNRFDEEDSSFEKPTTKKQSRDSNKTNKSNRTDRDRDDNKKSEQIVLGKFSQTPEDNFTSLKDRRKGRNRK